MIRVANAPCSWGILEFAPADSSAPAPEREGRRHEAPQFHVVLDEMRDAGYAGTELGDWGFMPTEPAALRRELARRRLEMVGAFVPVALAAAEAHEPGARTAVRVARLMRDAGAANALIVLSDDNAQVPARERHAGRIRPEHALDAAAWATFARGAEHIARAVRQETGLRAVFHPHCGGYVETPTEIDQLMTRTDPTLIGLVLDTGHILYGGGDPREVLDHYGSRVWHIHFKDCDPAVAARARQEELGYLDAVQAQLFCQLGDGAVDFAAITASLHARQYDGWIVVEQDVFPGYGTPAESARRSRQYLQRLGV